MKFLQTSIPENIELQMKVCDDSLPINGDVTQLHQILINLINNASQAVEHVEAAKITMHLKLLLVDKAFVDEHPRFNTGKYAHLCIEDNGCGIAEDQIQHLFEPFFTSKDLDKGTGLGLSMVYGAVRNHHGHVEVESTVGEGSTFHLYFPLQASNNVITMPNHERLASVGKGKGERILLADDQPQVLEVAKSVLESMGYDILTVDNGQLAVELYKSQLNTIDLCIFDVVMPVMSGELAAKEIRAIDPVAKIIFATGYDKSLLKDMDNEIVLAKPYVFEKLSITIRDMLDN